MYFDKILFSKNKLEFEESDKLLLLLKELQNLHSWGENVYMPFSLLLTWTWFSVDRFISTTEKMKTYMDVCQPSKHTVQYSTVLFIHTLDSHYRPSLSLDYFIIIFYIDYIVFLY